MKENFDYIKYACNVLNAWKIEYDKNKVTEFTGHVIDTLIDRYTRRKNMIEFMHAKYSGKSETECNEILNNGNDHETKLKNRFRRFYCIDIIKKSIGDPIAMFVDVVDRLSYVEAENAELHEKLDNIAVIVSDEDKSESEQEYYWPYY